MSVRVQSRAFSLLLPLIALGLLLAPGCEQKPNPPVKSGGAAGQTAEKGGHHHTHDEKGPHGGALVAIGNDAAHLEVVLDAESGKVTAWVLDGEAKNPVAIKADTLELTFVREHSHEHEDDKEGENDKEEADDHEDVTGSIVLAAVSPGDEGASEFAGESADLKGAEEFDAVLTAIVVVGQEFKNVKFNWPLGNEHDH